LHVRKLLAGENVATTTELLTQDFADLRGTTAHLLFGSAGHGSLSATVASTGFDQIMFGDANAQLTSSVVDSYYRGACQNLLTTETPPIPVSGPFGVLPFPVQQGVDAWIALLSQAAYVASINDATPTTRALVRSIAGNLSALEPPLVTSLDRSTKILLQVSLDQVSLGSNVLLAVSASVIGVIAMAYLLVFLPIVRTLVEEEESARLLLRMIPVYVRDQVPAISEFIETGKIDNAAELQKKFEASEKLLQNILPHKIASRLKSGEQPIADMHPCLTILFTDFVGFTKRSVPCRRPRLSTS